MGFTGLRFRANFHFITDIQLIQCLTILFGLFNLSVCLFEDQIGKFDWKHQYVGELKFAHFDTVSTAKKIIVATEENVIAALNLKSGQILWRQVLEKAQQGQIEYLNVNSEVVTVSGSNPWLVRTWDPTTGRLSSEWSLGSQVKVKKAWWFVRDDTLVQIIVGDDTRVSMFDLRTGANNGKASAYNVAWTSDVERCVLTQSVFSCLSLSDTPTLYYLNLTSPSAPTFHYPLSELLSDLKLDQLESLSISAVEGIIPVIHVQDGQGTHAVLHLGEQGAKLLYKEVQANGVRSCISMDYAQERVIVVSKETPVLYSVEAYNMAGEPVEDFSTSIPLAMSTARLYAGICASKKDKGIACRYLVSSSDQAISLIQNTGKVLWTREEALSHIVAVELLDLPVSYLDASIENEFNNKEASQRSWDIMSMLTRRLTSQMNQLHLFLTAIFGGRMPPSLSEQADLIRDEFSLHKMIVTVTKVGKIFGIDNLTGKTLWKRYLSNIAPFTIPKPTMLLYIQRTTRHYPRPAQCVLVARDASTSEGVLYMFNPITGEPTQGLVNTGKKIKQVMLLPKVNEDFLKEVVLLDEENGVQVYPQGGKILLEMVKKLFLFTADVETGVIKGYSLSYSTPQELVATQLWQLKLGTKDQQIINVISKLPIERVHSQGRVLMDRSVLYKYINPNLVAVVTHGTDAVHKYVMNIYLVDTVSGAVIYSISHKRAKQPIHVVHSENWLVYSYFNDKWRRTEVGTLELYEGKTQSNSTAFSSLAPPLLPMVERQSYIMPSQVEAMQVTITEKGITSKHVLMALNTGGVLEMPWMFLDPRRPATVTPEMREEGVVPYIPELPLPFEAIINYNQSLARIRGIHASPSGLESTCLVIVHGLDLFYTRVSPSKTFDLLKDDFDYSLIIIVLAALVLTSYITKQFASRKTMRQAWK